VNRRPLGARRDGAERYLLITIAAFAVTVAGTRWYLDLAGYPTIGGGGLHVAHVLWGGLALLVAAVLPMLFVGQRSLLLSALLAGIGVGLFIDEVGKFLTTTNDYFFAPAAPIIYGGILLLVLVWLIVRRRGHNRHDATQSLVEALRDGVDGRLTEHDRMRVIEDWRSAQESTAGDQDPLDDQLLATLTSGAMNERLGSRGWVASGRARARLEHVLPTRLERWLIIGGLLSAAAVAAIIVLILLFVEADDLLGEIAAMSAESGRLEVPSEPIWILLMFLIALGVGSGAIVAAVLMWSGRTRGGLNVAVGATLTNLVAGGLIGFYAVQSAALSSTVIGLVLLGLILDQRIRLQNATGKAGVDDTVD
jgi:hypothetical protein